MLLRRAALGIAVSLGTLAGPASSARSFQDLVTELQNRTRQKSPEIKSAESLDRQRSYQTYTAWTRWMPRLTFQTSKTRSKDYSLLTSGSLPDVFGANFTPEDADLVRWSLNATLPIYSRSAHLAIAQSRAEGAVATQQLETKISETTWRLRAYLGQWLLAAYREATSREALEAARTSDRETKLRFSLGQKTKIDVLKAESNLTALEAKRVTYEQQQVAERNNLLDYSGLALEDLQSLGLLDLVGSEEKLNALIADLAAESQRTTAALKPFLDQNSDQRNAHVIAHSPAFQTVRLEEDLSLERAASLMASEWPELNLQGSASKQSPSFKETYRGGQSSYSVGVVLTVPLFSGGSLFSSAGEQSAARETARIKAVRDQRALFNDVENETTRIKALLISLEANRTRVERDEEILRLSRKSYQLGKTSSLELLTAQNDLLTSKADLAETRIQLAVTAKQLAWHLGVNSP
ncbi:MAG: TolC family protein [Bdellovibrionales bacterium]|nr:TolC family protein [Bdellovibrionales bacterium]